MAIGKVHHVLCPVCHEPATTMYVYPDHICGVEGFNQTNSHLKCTNPEGTNSCAAGFHNDKTQFAVFQGQARIKARRTGETRRA